MAKIASARLLGRVIAGVTQAPVPGFIYPLRATTLICNWQRLIAAMITLLFRDNGDVGHDEAGSAH